MAADFYARAEIGGTTLDHVPAYLAGPRRMRGKRGRPNTRLDANYHAIATHRLVCDALND
jgi:hypothetical protein